jgi:tetratricopeptide (TPR) repeat protein
VEPGAAALSPTHVFLRAAELAPAAKPHRSASRLVSAAFLLPAFFVLGHQLAIASRAERLKANVPAAELDGIGGMWQSYHALGSRSLRLTTARLEEALTSRTIMLADGIIGNYRLPASTVRETQWKMARDAFKDALAVNPGDAELEGALRYCEGHLHRINGEARKRHRQNAEARDELTAAVSAFRDAAELRPAWPDPFLGLMRTFIYGFEDVDRGTDALKQAERLGYTSGERETVQLADGYQSRALDFARTARTLSGTAAQRHLARSADAYRQAIDLYSKALGYADARRSLRAARRGLEQVELRKTAASTPTGRPRTVRPFRAVGPRVVVPQ